MIMEETYDFSISMISQLREQAEEYPAGDDFQNFLRIRRELNHFLLSLNQSDRADGTGQQVHFLFMALEHLDNVDRELRITGTVHELKQPERVHDKIRSLKILILNYIRQLTDDN
jgi:hypothetical protein